MDTQIEFLLYSLPDDEGKVQVVVRDETLWCTQMAMAQLFGVQRPAITKHISNIFKEGELDEKVVCSILELTTPHGAIEGKTQTSHTKFYNLDMIIAVGYRVSSLRATRFRQWATSVLKEYIRKGFALDDNRLKQGSAVFGKDYFRELLERVRSIRASVRRIWQQITDVYAECSPSTPISTSLCAPCPKTPTMTITAKEITSREPVSPIKQKQTDMKQHPEVSVVIPVYNNAIGMPARHNDARLPRLRDY